MRIKHRGANVLEQREIKLTSAEWQNIYRKFQVLDPDGWDRQNYQYSWYEEKIDRNEYDKRLAQSTIKFRF